MTTKYAPTFAKDLDTYIVPNQQLVSDTVEGAVSAGAQAGLTNGYGLVATGETVVVDPEHGYAGPFIIATVGNIQAWIIGGPTFDKLTLDRHPAVANLQPESKYDSPADTQPVNDDGTLVAMASAIVAAEAALTDAPVAPEPTPEFGGGGGFDGAGAGGEF